jgi:serine-type D-Ala-D-Ala carboxypeptidase (penicillin-binding protein 5/6)
VTRTVLALVAALALALAASAPAAAQAPDPRGASAILVQPETGDVVYSKAPDSERPVASATKLMTALLTVEEANLDDVVPAVDYDALPVESQLGLETGERMTVRDLLRGLLLESANDAAATLARHVAGSRRRFVARMNERAESLGLRHTHFANPIGLDDPDNYSSARDLVKLTLILLREPFIARTVDMPSARLRSGDEPRRIDNRNTLVARVPYIEGVKTGHTLQAGYVLVAAARRDGVRLVSAVLGAPTETARDDDTLALLAYGFDRYRSVPVVKPGQVLAQPTLEYRDESVDVVASGGARAVVRRGRRAEVDVAGVPDEIDGPLPARARVGTAIVRRDGRVVARVPLVTAAAVEEASLLQRTTDFLGGGLGLALIAALLLSTLQLALMRRRANRRRRARARRRRGTETA